MAFYNLGHGGDIILNPNHGLYPQNAYLEGVNVNADALLRPAEHMSPATYNIWRNIRFGKEKFVTNWGIRDFLSRLCQAGTGIVAGDILGLVTLPHEAVVRGLYYRVESPQEGTSFQLVRVTTGEAIGPVIDASVARVGFIETGFIVPPDTNESIGIRIVTWPAPDSDPVNDPCGVYSAMCDELTLCFTLNAFIWSPVAEWFCTNDPCYGQGSGSPRDDGYMGGGLGADPTADANNPDPAPSGTTEGADAANSTVSGSGDDVSGVVEDQSGNPIAGMSVRVMSSDGTAVRSGTSGANGSFSFSGLPAGEYEIFAGSTLIGTFTSVP